MFEEHFHDIQNTQFLLILNKKYMHTSRCLNAVENVHTMERRDLFYFTILINKAY